MKFSIAAVPTGELNINNEIKLIKSVLLYADDITINSLADEAIGFYEHYGFTKGKHFAWMDIVISDNFKK